MYFKTPEYFDPKNKTFFFHSLKQTKPENFFSEQISFYQKKQVNFFSSKLLFLILILISCKYFILRQETAKNPYYQLNLFSFQNQSYQMSSQFEINSKLPKKSLHLSINSCTLTVSFFKKIDCSSYVHYQGSKVFLKENSLTIHLKIPSPQEKIKSVQIGGMIDDEPFSFVSKVVHP